MSCTYNSNFPVRPVLWLITVQAAMAWVTHVVIVIQMQRVRRMTSLISSPGHSMCNPNVSLSCTCHKCDARFHSRRHVSVANLHDVKNATLSCIVGFCLSVHVSDRVKFAGLLCLRWRMSLHELILVRYDDLFVLGSGLNRADINAMLCMD
jgi:hypothetical protein